MQEGLKILIGDVRKTLKDLPENSVNCCVTSPPYYGLREYATAEWEGGNPECEHSGNPCEQCGAVKMDSQIGMEDTPEEYIENLVSVFREIRRAMTDDGVCFINIGDSYYNYRPGKGQSICKQSMSKTKQDLPDTCARRGNKLEGLKEKDLIGIPWMLAFALRADGWYLRQDIIWAKACSGIYSGGTVMPESVKDRLCRSHEYIFLLTKNRNYYFDSDAIAEEQKDISLKRAYSNNNMDKRKGKGDEQYAISGKAQDKTYAKMRERIESGEEMKRNRRSVWTINTRPSSVAHFAAFPYELVEPMILAGCPVGGTVIDPFGGTGTTAIAANLLGRNAIHCELSKKYIGIIDERRKEIIKQKQTDGLNIANGKITKARKLF